MTIKGFRPFLGELLTGIGPVTSALPMRRTTDCATAASSLCFRLISKTRLVSHDTMVLSTVFLKFFYFFKFPVFFICFFCIYGNYKGTLLPLSCRHPDLPNPSCRRCPFQHPLEQKKSDASVFVRRHPLFLHGPTSFSGVQSRMPAHRLPQMHSGNQYRPSSGSMR